MTSMRSGPEVIELLESDTEEEITKYTERKLMQDDKEVKLKVMTKRIHRGRRTPYKLSKLFKNIPRYKNGVSASFSR